jgi:transposase
VSIEEMLAKLEAQTQRLDQLERAQRELAEERDQYKALYQQMLERYRKLERGMIGQKSERVLGGETVFSAAMLEMLLGERAAAEIDALAAQAEAETEEVRGHTRKKPTGRKPLPDHLPRVEIELVPDEVKREGTDAFERIGEEVVETLERRPASMVVVRTVRSKWKRKQLDQGDDTKVEVLIAEVPELPIPRGLAGPGMLADTIVRRWQDHMPANRLEDMYRREGVEIARSTICSWHDQLTPLGETLIAAMRTDSFEQPYLCTDATGVLVQAKEQCRRGHFFVVIAPGKHVLFEYTREHDSAAIDNILAGYEGYLVADAHAVYDHLYEPAGGPLVEVNCWAHARRYFFKAMGSDPDRAKVALKMIGALFRVERSIADKC